MFADVRMREEGVWPNGDKGEGVDFYSIFVDILYG